MGFTLNFANSSPIRTTFLLSLFTKLQFDPDYQWPSDYLTRTTSCALIFKSWQFVIVCDNACDNASQNKAQIFDYIIVGAGAAGSLLAYRLAQADQSKKVLLIEAGKEPVIDTVVPPLDVFLLNNAEQYVNFAPATQKYCNAWKKGCNCIVGKGIGGSTSINGMMYVYGCDEDYNNWAVLANDPTWKYENFVKYLRKTQDIQDPDLLSGSCANYQGTGGPLKLTSSYYATDKLYPVLKDSYAELGYSEKSTINCQSPFTGFGKVPMAIFNGQRQSAAKSFLVKLKNFNNFYLMYNSVVNVVTTEKDTTGNWVATGVSVKTGLSKCPFITLKASREVIISAGAYNSPMILQRSGIGKADELKKCGTNQISDVPSGESLSDHVQLLSFWTTTSNFSDFTGSFLNTTLETFQYLANFGGFFSKFPLNCGGFVNTAGNTTGTPDIQLWIGKYDPRTFDFSILMNDIYGYKQPIADRIIQENQANTILQVSVVLLQPKSRGRVGLGSCTDPNILPTIMPNYLDHPDDLSTLVKGMQILCQLFNTRAAKQAQIKPVIFDLPDCNMFSFCTSDYIKCYSTYFSMSGYHPTGTCKMGQSKVDSVVDSNLKVFGVKKLRVVDASTMPIVTSGNTMAPTYGIAEKTADTIIAANL